MSFSIYSPEVIAHAKRWNITELQAYRNLNAAEIILDKRLPSSNLMK